ncbi:MAG: helix-turn-helix domain-containing protein [Myxococcaceae bacterium]|nr:helix-turn-helix domain-containing protein [Myxococcaceae bacterium]
MPPSRDDIEKLLTRNPQPPSIESLFRRLGIPLSADPPTSIMRPSPPKTFIEIEIPKPKEIELDGAESDQFEALADLIRKEVRSLKKQTKKAAKPLRLMVSHREAARLLGIDRGSTLKSLIETGHVRTVKANGRTRIPLEEVQRLAEQGFDLSQSKPKRRRVRAKKSTAVDVEDAINKIKL